MAEAGGDASGRQPRPPRGHPAARGGRLAPRLSGQSLASPPRENTTARTTWWPMRTGEATISATSRMPRRRSGRPRSAMPREALVGAFRRYGMLAQGLVRRAAARGVACGNGEPVVLGRVRRAVIVLPFALEATGDWSEDEPTGPLRAFGWLGHVKQLAHPPLRPRQLQFNGGVPRPLGTRPRRPRRSDLERVLAYPPKRSALPRQAGPLAPVGTCEGWGHPRPVLALTYAG